LTINNVYLIKGKRQHQIPLCETKMGIHYADQNVLKDILV